METLFVGLVSLELLFTADQPARLSMLIEAELVTSSLFGFSLARNCETPTHS